MDGWRDNIYQMKYADFGANFHNDDDDDYYYYYYYGDYDFGEEYDDTSDEAVGGVTALHIAAIERSTKFVAKLLTVSNIIVDPKTEHGATPLYYAAAQGFVKMVTMLHAAGADIHAKEESGYTPIHAAVKSGNLEAVKTLIELGADMNVIGGYYMYTPLMLAVKYHVQDVAEYLVQMGADVDFKNARYMTALDYAKYDEMVQVLNGAGASVTDANIEEQECQIHEKEMDYYAISDLGLAVLENDVDAVDDLITKVK